MNSAKKQFAQDAQAVIGWLENDTFRADFDDECVSFKMRDLLAVSCERDGLYDPNTLSYFPDMEGALHCYREDDRLLAAALTGNVHMREHPFFALDGEKFFDASDESSFDVFHKFHEQFSGLVSNELFDDGLLEIEGVDAFRSALDEQILLASTEPAAKSGSASL